MSRDIEEKRVVDKEIEEESKYKQYPTFDTVLGTGGDMVSIGAFRWEVKKEIHENGLSPNTSEGKKEELIIEDQPDISVDSDERVWELTEDCAIKLDYNNQLKKKHHINITTLDRQKKEFEKHQNLRRTIRRCQTAEAARIESPVDLSNSLNDYKFSKPLNIAILVVGTRGDVQPFIALGLELVKYGHRVRIATHNVYREFVTSYNLEYYPLGGDPKVISEYVVRNRGIIPSTISDFTENRKQLKDVVFSTYDACTKPDKKGENEKEFMADAIIANPPAFGHIHCAEKLGIPLHMIFTMPWTPTMEFANPQTRISEFVVSKIEYFTFMLFEHHAQKVNEYMRGIVNWMSFRAVEDIVSYGLKDIIDEFRVKILNLKRLPYTNEARHLLEYRQVPFTYCWSPSLVPKPKDWADYINIVGFFFLKQSNIMNYVPPQDIQDFLDAGDAPVYIGFGSLVVDDPKKLTMIIMNALERTGLRAIVSKGWGGLGEGCESMDNVLLIGNCPHDWLFPKCCAVVHHGGAGTTASGLIAGCPTFIIPFFGDQPFWGEYVEKIGLGPKAIPIDEINGDKLTEALAFLLLPRVRKAASKISELMSQENGVKDAINAFHKNLPKEVIEDGCKMKWNLAEVNGEIGYVKPNGDAIIQLPCNLNIFEQMVTSCLFCRGRKFKNKRHVL